MVDVIISVPYRLAGQFPASIHVTRCKDCVYYDETPIYTEASSELSTENCHMFSHFDIPYPVEANGFCYLGKPKGVK